MKIKEQNEYVSEMIFKRYYILLKIHADLIIK